MSSASGLERPSSRDYAKACKYRQIKPFFYKYICGRRMNNNGKAIIMGNLRLEFIRMTIMGLIDRNALL